MSTSKTAPNDWMKKNGTGRDDVFADARGWCRTNPNGMVEVIQCMGNVVESPANIGGIQIIRNPASGSYILASHLDFKVTWEEPVNIIVSGGVPSLSFKIGERATLSITLTTTGDADGIDSVNVINGGSGYAVGGVITITGTGTLAAAHIATVGTGGVIKTIVVDTAGSGYTGTPTATATDTATTKTAVLIGGAKTGETKSTFRYVAENVIGYVNTMTTTMALNSGTIKSTDDGVTNVALTFPTDYEQPVDVIVV